MQPSRLPPKLQPGDLLCVISPSGGLQASEKFDAGLSIWKQRGYRVNLCEGFDAQWGYLAGRDDSRRAQLRHALADPECKAILCSRGGYGGTRLLEGWQWPALSAQRPPKWLIGFSDVTSLLWLGRVRLWWKSERHAAAWKFVRSDSFARHGSRT